MAIKNVSYKIFVPDNLKQIVGVEYTDYLDSSYFEESAEGLLKPTIRSAGSTLAVLVSSLDLDSGLRRFGLKISEDVIYPVMLSKTFSGSFAIYFEDCSYFDISNDFDKVA